MNNQECQEQTATSDCYEKPPGKEYYQAVLAVEAGIGLINQGGRNTHHKYNYARASDVIEPVRQLCVENGLVLEFGLLETNYTVTKRETVKEIDNTKDYNSPGKTTITEAVEEKGACWVTLELRIIHVETGQSFLTTCDGFSIETKGSDKALPKALTAAKKAGLMTLFSLSADDEDTELNDTQANLPKSKQGSQSQTTKPRSSKASPTTSKTGSKPFHTTRLDDKAPSPQSSSKANLATSNGKSPYDKAYKIWATGVGHIWTNEAQRVDIAHRMAGVKTFQEISPNKVEPLEQMLTYAAEIFRAKQEIGLTCNLTEFLKLIGFDTLDQVGSVLRGVEGSETRSDIIQDLRQSHPKASQESSTPKPDLHNKNKTSNSNGKSNAWQKCWIVWNEGASEIWPKADDRKKVAHRLIGVESFKELTEDKAPLVEICLARAAQLFRRKKELQLGMNNTQFLTFLGYKNLKELGNALYGEDGKDVLDILLKTLQEEGIASIQAKSTKAVNEYIDGRNTANKPQAQSPKTESEKAAKYFSEAVSGDVIPDSFKPSTINYREESSVAD